MHMLKMPRPQTQTLRLLTYPGSHRRREFIKVFAKQEPVDHRDEHEDWSLFGPYLVLAREWNEKKKNVHIYYPPRNSSCVNMREDRVGGDYVDPTPNSPTRRDIRPFTFTPHTPGRYPRNRLVPIPPWVTRENFENAMRIIMKSGILKPHNEAITATREVQERVEQSLTMARQNFRLMKQLYTISCMMLMLTGYPKPLPRKAKKQPSETKQTGGKPDTC